MDIIDFFPDIVAQSSREVDLNEEAKIYLITQWILGGEWNWIKENPLIGSEECQKLLKSVHEKYGIVWSHGGYGEDRSTLWHDTYLDMLRAWNHLGIDINVSAGTKLISPITGKVLISDHDSDHPTAPQNHGWWNRLIVQPWDSEYALIMAHLSDDTRRRVGNLIQQWEQLGTIGDPTQNGGWFEHFHIQAIAMEYLNSLIKEWRIPELDGYAAWMSEEIRKTYPNPLEIF